MKIKTKKKYRSFRWVLSTLKEMKKKGWRGVFLEEAPELPSISRQIRLVRGKIITPFSVLGGIMYHRWCGGCDRVIKWDKRSIEICAMQLGLQPLTVFIIEISSEHIVTSPNRIKCRYRYKGKMYTSKPAWRRQMLKVLDLSPDTE
jgi:hypothetical protein